MAEACSGRKAGGQAGLSCGQGHGGSLEAGSHPSPNLRLPERGLSAVTQ